MSSINKIKLLDQNLKDLVNGYCKQKYINKNNLSFPHALIILISLFCNFIDKSHPYLFKIQFRQVADGTSDEEYYAENSDNDVYADLLVSIASYFMISNRCYKLVITAGNQLQIIIGIKNNFILINNNKPIHNGHDELFKTTTESIEVMMKINKGNKCDSKDCDCEDCQSEDCDCDSEDCQDCQHRVEEINGSVELFFRNDEEVIDFEKRQYGQIKKRMSDGYYKIELNDNFDYQSKQKVSVESYTYGFDTIYVWSSIHAHLPCNSFGFGSHLHIDQSLL